MLQRAPIDERYFTPMPGRLIRNEGVALFVAHSGRGRALVLVHGLGWSHALWHRQIKRYASSYTIIAGDTRGHGASDAPAGPYSMQQLAADWAAVIAACGVDRYALVGFSQGGMLALMLAATHPERIAALGLFGTACRFSETAWSGMEQRAAALKAAGPLAAAEKAARSIFSERFVQQHPDFVRRFVEHRMLASFEALAAATQSLRNFDIRERLAAVKCPTLILHGTADQVIGPESAREMHRLMPQSEYHLIQGAGHMLPIECPNEVDAHLDRFLNTHYRSEE